MLLLSGCIVADPPEYQHPAQTRPALDEYGATPPTYHMLVVRPNDLVKITVGLRSEDAGEPLKAVFLADYNSGSSGLFQNSQDIAASTYADDTRTVTLDWTVPSLGKGGCHLLSLIVAHDSSFIRNPNYVLDQQAATKDAAIITWWLNVLDPSDPSANADKLDSCPTPGVPTK